MLLERIKQLIFILLLMITAYVFFLLFPFVANVIGVILSMILPFVLSFSLAFILNPIVTKLQNKVKKRSVAVFIVLCTIVLLVSLLIVLTVPKLIEEVEELVVRLPDIITQLQNLLNELCNRLSFLPNDMLPSIDNIQSYLLDYINKVGDFPSVVLGTISKYVGIIALIPVSLIYFLLDYEKIINGARNYLINKGYNNFKNCLGEINTTMMNFFKGYFIIMLILSVTSSIVLMFLGIDFALILGIIIGVTDIIPFIGSYIGGAIPVIYAFLESPTKALYVIIAIVVIQLIESNLLTPYIQSKQTKTHPLLVILSLIVFGRIFGFIGMIIAVPLLSIIKIILKYYPLKLFKKGAKNEKLSNNI